MRTAGRNGRILQQLSTNDTLYECYVMLEGAGIGRDRWPEQTCDAAQRAKVDNAAADGSGPPPAAAA